MSGRLQFDSVEKDFKYSKDLMGLIKVRGKVEDEDFGNTKSDQVDNLIEILRQIEENEVVIFTDGSALGSVVSMIDYNRWSIENFFRFY